MLYGDYVLIGLGTFLCFMAYFIGTRPTVTPEEQDRLIEFGHK
ncbi:MAG: hypothetical protein JWQ11_3584 [Rhizobacter sp.]|nr:hypothetical protein [Rhizobacter sp.]